MAYLVNVTARATRDLAELYGEINAEHFEAALKWYRGLKQVIVSLEHHPTRCPLMPGEDDFRQLLYGHKPHVYRVIYRVRERQQQADVLHIRHGARGNLKPSDVA
jgi:toxin ParE1/3/4